jgi:glucose/arabinose dehydrogenase
MHGQCEDLMTGFVTSQGKVWGRHVEITVAKSGNRLTSEDSNGTIWRVSYGK